MSSLPLAYLAAVAVGGTTPMHVTAQTGQFLLAAVPIAALLAPVVATVAPFCRRPPGLRCGADARGVGAPAAGGRPVAVAGSAPQRPRLPAVDRLNAVAPLVVMLVTALPRVRGVAPMTFVGLLVFSLAPLGGSQLTRALAMTRTGGELVLNAGLTIGTILLALPTGWMAWRCLAATARAFATKRVADSEMLVNVWWVMFVSAFWIDYVNMQPWSWSPLLIAVAVSVAFAVLYR